MNFTSPRAGQQKLRSWAARESFTSESERCRFCFCTRMPRSAAKGRTALMSYWQAGCTCWGQTTSCNVTSRCRWTPFGRRLMLPISRKKEEGGSRSLSPCLAPVSRAPQSIARPSSAEPTHLHGGGVRCERDGRQMRVQNDRRVCKGGGGGFVGKGEK